MGCQRIVLIWCLLCCTSQAYSEKRCTVLGNREELKLWEPEKKLKDIKDITWRNSTHTLGRIKNGVKSGLFNISEDGTLQLGILQNIAINNYSAKVFNTQGKLIHEAVISLQVIEPIPKPSLAFMCKPKLMIHCNFTHAPESAIYWERNGKPVDDTRATFKDDKKTMVLNAQYEPTDRFACIVQYCGTKVKNESTVPCTAEGNRRNKILGLEFWYFVAAIAGGGVLLIILVSVLLVYQCQKKRKQRQCQDEDQFLPNLSTPSNQGQQKLQPPPRSQSRGPPVHPHGPELPKPRAKGKSRPPHTAGPPLDDQPPPRPRPRQRPPPPS